MQNEFLKLASSPLMNLDHTYRYSGTKLVEAESLSQHIVDTIMMGLKVIDEINHIEEDAIDPQVYLMKAVYHDLEEVITGDIPRPLKYYNADTRDSLKDVADKVAKEFFSKEFNDGFESYNVWNYAKIGKEGFILKLVDTLVVANKVIKEVTMLNNYYMLRVAYEVSQYLKDIAQVNYFENEQINEYLSCVVEGAIEAMLDILDKHEDCMESLAIHRQSMI